MRSVSILTIPISCSGGKMPEKNISYDSLKEVPVSAWKKLSQKKYISAINPLDLTLLVESVVAEQYTKKAEILVV